MHKYVIFNFPCSGFLCSQDKKGDNLKSFFVILYPVFMHSTLENKLFLRHHFSVSTSISKLKSTSMKRKLNIIITAVENYLGNGSIWFSNFPKKVLCVSRTPKRTAF